MSEGTDLTTLTDETLKFQWSIEAFWVLSDKAMAIKDELVRRGYHYDSRYHDFLTCEEWNNRHGDWSPMNCEESNHAS